MNYYKQDFMIKLGETNTGNIIEVPDILILIVALMIASILFSLLSNNQWKKKNTVITQAYPRLQLMNKNQIKWNLLTNITIL